ncbi:MAG: threonine/serine exporter family protein [Clostridia bacterium]
MPQTDIQLLIRVAKTAAALILESGAETFRAEETVQHICQPFLTTPIEVMALPTGVIITLHHDYTDYTSIIRIKKRGINLAKLQLVNSISRQVSHGEISLLEAEKCLAKVQATKGISKIWLTLAVALSSGFFALLFSGTITDFFIATFAGACVQLVTFAFDNSGLSKFIKCIVAGALTALIALIFTNVFQLGAMDKIIIGAIMPMLPGLPLTSAIRDTIQGDLISGVARGAEALLIAAALGVGVGIMLKLWLLFGGVMFSVV